jgi:hypothetical protein
LNYGGSQRIVGLGLVSFVTLSSRSKTMGMWIELGVFGLVFVFALHQWNDLKKEKLKREQQKAAADAAHDDKT